MAELDALDDGVGRHRFQVVTPDLDIRVDAPAVADREPFTLPRRLAIQRRCRSRSRSVSM